MKITIDGRDIRLNAFVHKATSSVLTALIDSLADIPDSAGSFAFVLDRSGQAALTAGNLKVRMNPFVRSLSGHILQGILESLDDIPPAYERAEFILNPES